MEEKNNAVIEEGALKVTKLTMYEAMAIIVGANIGSGILGLAYSTRLAGWPILLLWLIVAVHHVLHALRRRVRTAHQKAPAAPRSCGKVCRQSRLGVGLYFRLR